MSVFGLSDNMLAQSQHFAEGYYQNLMMTAALCNYTDQSSTMAPQPEELECEAELLNADLWKEFHALGTEMIITKNGRRMFPPMSVQVRGLHPGGQYSVSLELWAAGGGRWRRVGGRWTSTQGGLPQGAPSQGGVARALHPDAPAPACRWAQPFSFKHVKLTNNVHDDSGNIVLSSMFKYQPRVRVARVGGAWPAEKCFTFPETEFIAVTAYQNENITKLKIDNNPFAKGFREYGQGRCKRKCRSPSPTAAPGRKAPRSSSLSDSSQDESINKTEDRLSTASWQSPEVSHFFSGLHNESGCKKKLSIRTQPSPLSTSSHSPLDSGSNSLPKSPIDSYSHICNERLIRNQRSPLSGSPPNAYVYNSRNVMPSMGSQLSPVGSSAASVCSVASESPVSVGRVTPQHEVHPGLQNALHEARYLQLAEWARCLVYGGAMWYPTGAPPPPPACWHCPEPLPPAPLPPPPPACRTIQRPKGSSFTIRALIGEN